jgi:hypothetical protein
MRNIPLPRRGLLRAGLLTLLAFGGLPHDARSQDTPSPQSPKPATEPKLILEGAIKSASQLCRLLMHVAPVICPTSVRSQDP